MDPTSVEQRDATRLDELHDSLIHDPAVSASCNDFARLAELVFNAPLAAVAFIRGPNISFKGPLGISAADSPALSPLLACAVAAREPFIVEDTARDPLFQAHTIISAGREIRAFAGLPI